MEMYFTSDQHFGHPGILKVVKRRKELFGDDLDLMNKTIIDNFNAVVNKDDEVYILGDNYVGRSKDEFIEIIQSLNGKLHFVAGNHDARRYNNWLLEAGYDFDKVGISLKKDHKKLMLTHYGLSVGTYPFDENDNSRITERRWSVHGHIHEWEYPQPYQINVCIDSPLVADKPFGEPISWTELKSIIESRESEYYRKD